MTASRPVPAVADVRATYERDARGYDQRHAHTRTARRFAVLDHAQLVGIGAAERVLELGCGTARLLAQSRAPLRVGVDVAVAMAREAKARVESIAVADAHALPFASASFDAILAGNGVFRYLDYAAALAECARVLRVGGRLAVHQFAAAVFGPLSWRAPPQPLHLRTAGELTLFAVAAGFGQERRQFWRSVRWRPYLVPVPPWLADVSVASRTLWNHCTFIYRLNGPAHRRH